MISLIQIELYKILKRPRTYIGFLAIFIIVVGLQMAMYFEGESLVTMGIQNLKNDFRLEGGIINVNLMTYILMNSLIIHIPILICLVTGDLIAGEASSGTLRLILQRPHSRSKIYLSKIITGFVYSTALILFMGLTTYLSGLLLFGNGDLIVLRRGVNVFSADDVFWRFTGAFSMGLLSMIVVASLSLMISSFVRNAIVPIVGTISVIIVLNIIFTLGANFFEPILPYVFTTHFIKWQYFFDFDLNYNAIYKAIGIQLAYIITFNAIGLIHFKNKDILS
ncbi:MAG: ABC transporter permease subunit [Flavobacteriales bacterium]|nr:ABC transporter permease subunit [Flavobacteriales bacterium]